MAPGLVDLWVDGQPASAADLGHIALVNYGAYTSFRVQQSGVRGLDLHLARLEASAVELFGEEVGQARLRDLMRAAVAGRDLCWLRVSLFSNEIGMRQTTWRGAPRVMVGVFPAPEPLAGPLSLQVQSYRREAAHLKHTATFGLVRARRAARDAGFDDALFVDQRGRVSEGSLWNIGFVSDRRVTWPRAPMLAGIGQALIQRGLDSVGLTGETRVVHLGDMARFSAAFICNSATPACAVATIGERVLRPDADLIERLRAAWTSNPLQPI